MYPHRVSCSSPFLPFSDVNGQRAVRYACLQLRRQTRSDCMRPSVAESALTSEWTRVFYPDSPARETEEILRTSQGGVCGPFDARSWRKQRERRTDRERERDGEWKGIASGTTSGCVSSCRFCSRCSQGESEPVIVGNGCETGIKDRPSSSCASRKGRRKARIQQQDCCRRVQQEQRRQRGAGAGGGVERRARHSCEGQFSREN